MVNVGVEDSKLGRIGEMIGGSRVGADYQPYILPNTTSLSIL